MLRGKSNYDTRFMAQATLVQGVQMLDGESALPEIANSTASAGFIRG